MTELDDAVSALVDPVVYHHEIKGRTFVVELECRLDQLDGRISATLGGAGSSKALKNERSVLNSEALELFQGIELTIREWCRRELVLPNNDAATNLRRWRAAITDHDAGEYEIRQMLNWAVLIDQQAQPVKRAPIEQACPICKAETWTDGDGEEHLHPLERSHVDGELMTTARALCKACKAVWEGVEAVTELGDELAE